MADYVLDFGPLNYIPQAAAAGLAVSRVLDLTNSDILAWEFAEDYENVIYLSPPHRMPAANDGNIVAYLNYTVPQMWWPTTTVTPTTTTHTTPTTTTPAGGWTVDWELLWRAIAEGESVDTAWASHTFTPDVPMDAWEMSEVSGTFDPMWQAGDKVEFAIKRDGDDVVNDEWPNVAWWLHLQICYST